MLQFNPALLNRNVAPGIAEFTVADMPDLRPDFPQSEHWLANHFLNTLLGSNYVGPFRQYAINMLSRAQAQFALFHQAREATAIYLKASTLHNPAVRHYYAAIVLWESSLLNYQIFIDLYTKAVGKKAFAPGDLSEEQRAYDIANAIKHWGGVINSRNRNDDHTIPMWLSNAGFHSHAHALTYLEFAAITREIAKAADELQNPAAPAAQRGRSALKTACVSDPDTQGRAMPNHKIFATKFARVYPLYVQKAERKNRTRAEVDQIIYWLTGYDQEGLQQQIERGNDFEAFFAQAPVLNPNSALIKGVVCGVRVEEIENPLMQKIRYLDKLIDELAKGKAMAKILRQ